MALIQNVPFFCIMLYMFSGTVSSVLPGKWARRLNMAMLTLVTSMSTALLVWLVKTGTGTTVGCIIADGIGLDAGSVNAI